MDPIVSRKKQRKLQREEKKKRKNLYYNRGHLQLQSNKQCPIDDDQNLKKKKEKDKIKTNHLKEKYIEHQKCLIRKEEKEIKKYEKLLKLKSYTKRNKLPKSFYLDGLADLINFCDGNLNQDENKEQPSDNEDNDEEEIDAEEYTNNTENEEEEVDDNNIDCEKDDNGSEFYEDIYGFIRDKNGNILKNKDNKKEQLISEVIVDENLQRKLRGLLNRLTSFNIKVIIKEIIDLNKTYSRHVINKGIMNCIDKMIIDVEYGLPSKLVAEIAILIATLCFEMGEDVGGFFIHSIIYRFDNIFNDHSFWDSTKKLNNILILILNIHSTGLIDGQLIYDIIDKFCNKFDNEKSIEIIDLILKTSGFLLRKEDASKMKSLILKIQNLSKSIENFSGSRMKFILESLIAIKNNNISKIKTAETIVMNDLIENTLKSVIKKTRVPAIPGQYSAILQSSHWFSFTKEIVPLETVKPMMNENYNESPMFMGTNIDYNLRDRICKALRINTPLRRDLFTALFSCNDYFDAAGKLISIGKKQSSEIINIVLHVAINEKFYNDFYFYLLRHLTNCDRKYKLALDFAIRDKITGLESLTQNNRLILQKLIFNLLKDNCLSITCLKVIQFSDMNEMYVNFIRSILQSIFNEDETMISSIMSKIPKKDNFAGAISLFISYFMDDNAKNQAFNIKEIQFKLKNSRDIFK